MLYFGTEIELLHEIDVITDFDSNMRGGITSAVKGNVTFDNKYLRNFDEQKQISTGIFLYSNAFYATILYEKLPVGGFFELSNEKVASFGINAIDLHGSHCYALVIEFEIPDGVKIKTEICNAVTIHQYFFGRGHKCPNQLQYIFI